MSKHSSTIILLVLAWASLSNALNCNLIKFALGKSAFDAIAIPTHYVRAVVIIFLDAPSVLQMRGTKL